MALWNRAGIYYVKLKAPDGTLLRRSTGTSDRRKAEEYHDRLKAELWDLAYLKKKPKRTWDEAALRLERQLGKHRRNVFTYRGRPLKSANTRTWRAALKACGIRDFRWHDLRHTWATWLRQNDVPTWVLQELGGWKSEVMVRRYAHMSVKHLAPFADQLTFPVTGPESPGIAENRDSANHKNGHSGAGPKLHLVISN